MPTDNGASVTLRVGTAKDAAAILHVRVEHVYRMQQAGELPREAILRRIGPRLRFDLDVLERWMREPVQ